MTQDSPQTSTHEDKTPARSGRVVVLALLGLIAIWSAVLAVLVWRGVQSPRWLRLRDAQEASQSPQLVVQPSSAPSKQ